MHVCFVVFVLVFFSVLSQDIGCEERLQNDIFCVGWDVKPQLTQSVVFIYVFCSRCVVLATDSQTVGSSNPSIPSPGVGEERVNSGHWLGLVVFIFSSVL